MWKTESGVRKLVGKERRLFMAGTSSLFSWLDDLHEIDEDWSSGSPAFDKIPIENRRWVLLLVAESLLGDGPDPSLGAWNEGAVLAVFTHLLDEVDVEIDNQAEETLDDPVYLRSRIHEAWMEKCDKSEMAEFGEGEGPHQPLDSTDSDEWDSKIEFLADQILFDRDCESEVFMDLNPAVAEMCQRELGIGKEYYVDIPPLLRAGDRKRLKDFLRELDD